MKAFSNQKGRGEIGVKVFLGTVPVLSVVKTHLLPLKRGRDGPIERKTGTVTAALSDDKGSEGKGVIMALRAKVMRLVFLDTVLMSVEKTSRRVEEKGLILTVTLAIQNYAEGA
jgi:hypothetical protein